MKNNSLQIVTAAAVVLTAGFGLRNLVTPSATARASASVAYTTGTGGPVPPTTIAMLTGTGGPVPPTSLTGTGGPVPPARSLTGTGGPVPPAASLTGTGGPVPPARVAGR